jgi:hypothetical protein
MPNVIRPACLSDVSDGDCEWEDHTAVVLTGDRSYETAMALTDLYNHEWKRRGFTRSP